MILPYGTYPACPKCERTHGVTGCHGCHFVTEGDSEFLEWRCWFCGYLWRSLTADDKSKR